ncbi:MAG: hypothetical protein ACM3KR_06840 [Deltaproteobacteria bacterium]
MLAAQKRYDYDSIPEYQDYQRESKAKIVTVTRKKAVLKLKAIFGILIFFVVGMFILSRYSMINQEKKNIYKLKTEITKLNKENTQAQMALNMKVDLEQVEKDAIQQLGMQYPDKNQTIYVQIPKNDFTEVPLEAESEASKEAAPVSFARQLLSYLY